MEFIIGKPQFDFGRGPSVRPKSPDLPESQCRFGFITKVLLYNVQSVLCIMFSLFTLYIESSFFR